MQRIKIRVFGECLAHIRGQAMLKSKLQIAESFFRLARRITPPPDLGPHAPFEILLPINVDRNK